MSYSRVIAPPASATAYRCGQVSESSTTARGIVATSAARATSMVTITGRRAARSSQTPAGRASRKNGIR
ncbi:hypothetical protein GA0115255_122385 [Streptomyces sp. Ncost-T6T-2b]|nr:hypothetical protein GA0115255_122385 [Streptomyces sp. Ncost-T6T-2b]